MKTAFAAAFAIISASVTKGQEVVSGTADISSLTCYDQTTGLTAGYSWKSLQDVPTWPFVAGSVFVNGPQSEKCGKCVLVPGPKLGPNRHNWVYATIVSSANYDIDVTKETLDALDYQDHLEDLKDNAYYTVDPKYCGLAQPLKTGKEEDKKDGVHKREAEGQEEVIGSKGYLA